MTTEKFYTPVEVADILRIRRGTVYKLILDRKLPATVIGKQYRISESQLQEYLKSNTIQRVE